MISKTDKARIQLMTKDSEPIRLNTSEKTFNSDRITLQRLAPVTVRKISPYLLEVSYRNAKAEKVYKVIRRGGGLVPADLDRNTVQVAVTMYNKKHGTRYSVAAAAGRFRITKMSDAEVIAEAATLLSQAGISATEFAKRLEARS